MKYLAIGIVTLAMLLCDNSVTEAGLFNRRPRVTQRLWSPGILIHLTREGIGVRSGPRMVWRGDWVPAYMVR